jgi:hypothetical protein
VPTLRLTVLRLRVITTTSFSKNITFCQKWWKPSLWNFSVWRLYYYNYRITFLFDQTLDKCSNSNQVYNFTSSEAMQLNIDPSPIANQVTPLNTPRTGLITSSTNSLTSGGVLTNSFLQCSNSYNSHGKPRVECSRGVSGTSV